MQRPHTLCMSLSNKTFLTQHRREHDSLTCSAVSDQTTHLRITSCHHASACPRPSSFSTPLNLTLHLSQHNPFAWSNPLTSELTLDYAEPQPWHWQTNPRLTNVCLAPYIPFYDPSRTSVSARKRSGDDNGHTLSCASCGWVVCGVLVVESPESERRVVGKGLAKCRRDAPDHFLLLEGIDVFVQFAHV